MKKESSHKAAHMHMKKAAHHSEMAMKAMGGSKMPGNPKEEKSKAKKGDKKGSMYGAK